MALTRLRLQSAAVCGAVSSRLWVQDGLLRGANGKDTPQTLRAAGWAIVPTVGIAPRDDYGFQKPGLPT
jgi:hypothetical protein